jgi:hypothetical protein
VLQALLRKAWSPRLLDEATALNLRDSPARLSAALSGSSFSKPKGALFVDVNNSGVGREHTDADDAGQRHCGE